MNRHVTSSNTRQFVEFLLMGMEQLWFVLALLAPGNSPFALATMNSARSIRLEYFQKLIAWLPHILAVSRQLRTGAGQGFRIPGWAFPIIHAAMNAGWKRTSTAIETKFGGDWLAALIADDVIEPGEIGFRIHPEFAAIQ